MEFLQKVGILEPIAPGYGFADEYMVRSETFFRAALSERDKDRRMFERSESQVLAFIDHIQHLTGGAPTQNLIIHCADALARLIQGLATIEQNPRLRRMLEDYS